MFSEDFYVNFGKAVFALAMSDGAIHPEEQERLMTEIKRMMAPIEDTTDEFGMNLAFYTVFAFEQEAERAATPDRAFHQFLSYVRDHSVWIPPETRKVLIEVLRKVADSYGGTDTAEQDIIERFRRKLEEVQEDISEH